MSSSTNITGSQGFSGSVLSCKAGIIGILLSITRFSGIIPSAEKLDQLRFVFEEVIVQLVIEQLAPSTSISPNIDVNGFSIQDTPKQAGGG
ncbi:hypothetical protein JCM15764A_36620 [Geotalea toluenoxydans]